ncbi:MAG: RNA-binding S4 domain-containing protein [Bacteroidales bacterium]|nr:RNA-binding S4 domain-containing protein [Bacteroidales bacterium]
MDSIRIDKYLWAVRIYKTRSEATEACNGNKVRIGGAPAKPGKAVKVGDMLEVHKGPALLPYKVLQLSSARMGAQLVPDFLEDLTPESERAKFHAPKETIVLRREKGTGRPTKKDRRNLDALMEMLD